MHLRYFIFLVISFFMSCNNEPIEIFRLDSFCSEEVINGELNITEVYVVSHIPRDHEKIKKILKDFNQKAFNSDTSQKKVITRTRTFYRQSKGLDVNFESKDPNKSGYFEKNDLSGYYKDKIYLSRWTVYDKVIGHDTWYLKSIRGETDHYEYTY